MESLNPALRSARKHPTSVLEYFIGVKRVSRTQNSPVRLLGRPDHRVVISTDRGKPLGYPLDLFQGGQPCIRPK